MAIETIVHRLVRSYLKRTMCADSDDAYAAPTAFLMWVLCFAGWNHGMPSNAWHHIFFPVWKVALATAAPGCCGPTAELVYLLKESRTLCLH